MRLLNASACLQIVVHTSVTNMRVCLKHGCVTAWVSTCYLGEYSVIRNDATKKILCVHPCVHVCRTVSLWQRDRDMTGCNCLLHSTQ